MESYASLSDGRIMTFSYCNIIRHQWWISCGWWTRNCLLS